MNGKLEKIVDESIKLELNLAALYEIFSLSFPEDSFFWNKLIEEEKNHALLIKTGRDLLLTCDEFPTEILAPSLQELLKVNTNIKTLIKEYNEAPPSRKAAFEVASALEQSAGEMHFNEAMDKPSDNMYINTFKRLNKEDKHHCQRILDYMNLHGL